ncbi:aromatic prenyltransferase protein [Rutstroemia sp. NJR-2017a BVV2]|nr:aromatic prenyltransferase protein [Rutstroemia sp. NJR-2017a BVV2]
MSELKIPLSSDEIFWWKICKPAISGLMDHAGTYTPVEKDNNLKFFAQSVTPLLGPQPSSQITSDASPLDVASPVEASLNFSAASKPIVRFQFEPLSATVGARTDADPFGQARVRAVLAQMENQAVAVDLQWPKQFIEAFFPIGSAEIARVKAKEHELPFPLDHALTFNIAFDLDGDRRKMKAYFLPMAKSLATGESPEFLTWKTIRSLDPYGVDLSPTVDMLDDYFEGCPDTMAIDMIGIDCAQPSKARIKVYAHMRTMNSWNTVHHVCTFGGQAQDETRLQGLKIFHSIYHLLLDEQEPQDDNGFNKPMRLSSSFLGSIMFSFEMLTGCQFPEVKTYVPLWQYGASDGQIAQNLSSVFRKLGWNAAADNYLAKLKACFPGAELDGPPSLHSNVSFAYSQKTGAYMTVYYAVNGKSVCASRQG